MEVDDDRKFRERDLARDRLLSRDSGGAPNCGRSLWALPVGVESSTLASLKGAISKH